MEQRSLYLMNICHHFQQKAFRIHIILLLFILCMIVIPFFILRHSTVLFNLLNALKASVTVTYAFLLFYLIVWLTVKIVSEHNNFFFEKSINYFFGASFWWFWILFLMLFIIFNIWVSMKTKFFFYKTLREVHGFCIVII